MRLTKTLLGSTAMACLLATLGTAQAQQAEVTPGGALNVEVSGFAYGQATGGDIDNAQLDDAIGTGLDFSNDTEVHFLLSGKDDATGTEYGGTVEFEADTNAETNTDETWIFVRGGWGGLRLGDEDGITDDFAPGAQNVASGTGGLDGTLVDSYGTSLVFITGTSDATKAIYYSPTVAGFQAAVSYTPNQDGINSGDNNGDDVAVTDVDAGDTFEGGIIYDGELGGVDLGFQAVGLYGDVKDEDDVGGDDYWGWAVGGDVGLFGLVFAGAYTQDKVGDTERQFFNLGAGYEIGAYNFSVNYGQLVDSEDLVTNDNELDKPRALVFSGSAGLAPGLVLLGDVSFFDNDVQEGPKDDSDDGVIGILALGIEF